MKKIGVFAVFLLAATQSLAAGVDAVGFGIDIKSSIFRLEKTPYIPKEKLFAASTESNFYVRAGYQGGNFLFGISPNIQVSGNNIYFNIYKLNFNLFFRNFVFSIEKDTLWFGTGHIYNCLVPQQFDITQKNSRIWNARLDYTQGLFSISAASILDNSIDTYKKPEAINPYIVAAFNTEMLNISLSMDYMHRFEGAGHLADKGRIPDEKGSLKNAAQIQLLLPKQFSLYSSADILYTSKKIAAAHFDLGVSQRSSFSDFSITVIAEGLYSHTAEAGGTVTLAPYFSLDYKSIFGMDAGVEYAIHKTVKSFVSISAYYSNAEMKFFWQSGNFLDSNDTLKQMSFGIGFKYEV